MSRKRILYLDHTAAMGGGEVALINLIQHLDRSRYVLSVALFAEGPLAGALREAGIETHILLLADEVINTRKDSLRGWGLLRGGTVLHILRHVRQLARFIRAGGYDIVHCNSLKSDILGSLAAKLAGVKVLWHVRDRIDADYLPRPAVVGFRLACCLLPDFLVANSQSTLDLIRPLFARLRGERTAQKRMRVIHDGVAAAAFIDVAKQESKEMSIGLVGRISRWKGQDVFIRAAKIVLGQHPGCRFKIIGAALFSEQAFDTEIRRLVQTLGLADSVEFTGFRADVMTAIAELDILVHASVIGEPFGQVIVEGMAAGKPVVATRGGGVPEIVQDGITGLLVPMGDAGAMAGAICRLLSYLPADAAMGRAGRARVQQCFRIENTAKKVEAFYDDILESRRKRTES